MRILLLLFCTFIFVEAQKANSSCLRTNVLKVAREYTPHKKLDKVHAKAIKEIRQAYKNWGADYHPFGRDLLSENHENFDLVLESIYVRYDSTKPIGIKRLTHIDSKKRNKTVVEYYILPGGEHDRYIAPLKQGSFDLFLNECNSTNLPLKKMSLMILPKLGDIDNPNSDSTVLMLNDSETISEVPERGIKSYGSVNMMYIICNSPTGPNRNLAALAVMCERYKKAGYLPSNTLGDKVGSKPNGGSNTQVQTRTAQDKSYGYQGVLQGRTGQGNSYGNQVGPRRQTGQGTFYGSQGGAQARTGQYKSWKIRGGLQEQTGLYNSYGNQWAPQGQTGQYNGDGNQWSGQGQPGQYSSYGNQGGSQGQTGNNFYDDQGDYPHNQNSFGSNNNWN
ncbi:hypothetical protein ANCCAN_06402 [Ancylostoma caninum]|uniref:Uncharacterized protein n=1 Tax=Ancylostoma caninum TaxID=29170 RepID=A0A368GWU8_ANCCA|nr:hypothetical protein ANCCAN_06402 [Ancylostoma caninum]